MMSSMFRLIIVVLFFQLKAFETTASDDEFLLYSESLPDDLNFMPTLGNGHLGYTVFGNAIYMNGVYNGHDGDSRRARIQNWLNLSVSILHDNTNTDNGRHVTQMSSFYEMNLRDGYFRWKQSIPAFNLDLEQRIYAHRFYNRALIYELLVQRTETKAPLKLKLTQLPGDASEAFNFTPLSVSGVNVTSTPTDSNEQRSKWKLLKGITKTVENELFQKQPKTIFVILSEDLEHGKLLEMATGQRELHYLFILTADEDENVASLEMQTVQSLHSSQLFKRHAAEWNNFWQSFHIQVNDNIELSQSINAGLFYLASSLPSQNTFQPNKEYYGLSPAGLGRGERDADYEGHNFWDTEIWMFPTILQLSTEWARELLGYRERCLPGAQYNARITGYKGARYPWESAYTGTEVTNRCCPEVAANEVHITADIALAIKHYFTVTNDANFLCENAYSILSEISDFLVDRVVWNPMNNKYHIKNVMGPDEDHENVTDSVYTNLSFKLALEFANYVKESCSKNTPSHNAWHDVSDNLFIPYDSMLNYHPQYVGYKIGDEIKQADAILLGYPLQYQMNDSTRLNDLHIYESVTRKSGPAMTWSMFSINYLDVNETDKADNYFYKSYQKYIRKEFKVWSEVQLNYHGAANFLTGIGGFIQAIINGYAGVRFYHDQGRSILEIHKRHVLPKTSGFTIHGLRFAGASFDIDIQNSGDTNLKCISIGDKKLELRMETEIYTIHKGFSIQMGTQTALLQTA